MFALVRVLFSLLDTHGLSPKIIQQIICNSCGLSSSQADHDENCPSIILTVSESSRRTVTIQELLNDYCRGSTVSASCDSIVCRGGVNVKSVNILFSYMPNTIVILVNKLKRVGQIYVKNDCLIQLNKCIDLHAYNRTRDVEYTCQYNLCSVVSHTGRSLNHGHYTASIFREHDGQNSFVVCDDTSICTIDAESTVSGIVIGGRNLKDAVVLVYNRHFTDTKGFHCVMQALQHTSGVHSLVDAMHCTSVANTQRRYKILSYIANGRHEAALSEISALGLHEQPSTQQFIVKLLEYLICTCEWQYNTFYMHSSSNGTLKNKEKKSTVLFVETSGVVTTEVFMSALCASNNSHQRNVLFFPESVMCLCRAVKQVDQCLNLSACIRHIHPTQTLIYTFSGLLLLSSENVQYSTNVDNVNARNSDCILFYNLNKRLFCMVPIEHSQHQQRTNSNAVGLMHSVIDTSSFNCVTRTYNGISLSTGDWELILSSRWFTDVVVDCYLYMLATSCTARVLPYKCTWFNTLFYGQNPEKPKVSLCRTEHSKALWFNSAGEPQYDFVIIPGSILNSHFVVIVIDLQKACIHVCDSMRGSHNSIVNQVARYVAQEHFIATGKPANLSMFTYNNYCTWDSDFPVQQDSHNCGPYICLLAKCIVQNKLLRMPSHKALRRTVCIELLNGILL